MTNKEILKVVKGLDDLSQLKLALNIKTSYNLARIKSILTPVVDTIQEKQMELYRKYGEETDGTITVPKEKVPHLEAELDELLDIENKVQLMKLKLEDFGDAEIPFDIIEELLPVIIEI